MKQSDLSLQINDIYPALELELSLHPKLELVDIYKFVFQAYFGPSHIIKNREQVAQSIFAEVMSMQQSYLPLFQDIGNKQSYWRLSLGLLLPDIQLGEEFLMQRCGLWADAMLDSCLEPDPRLGIKERWSFITPLVRDLFEASAEDWEQVNAMAAREQIPSHSLAFTTAYHPHYRLLYPVGENFLKLLD